MDRKRKTAVRFIAKKSEKCKPFKKKRKRDFKLQNLAQNQLVVKDVEENTSDKFIFKSLTKLLNIINQELAFKIQVFSLESVELFMFVLKKHKVKYNLQFSSSYKNSSYLSLILKDSVLPDFPSDSRLILFSNSRNKGFVPYKFVLSADEKKHMWNNDVVFEINKRNTLSYVLNEKIDIHKYTAESLTYTQCMIVFSMVNKNKLADIFKEVVSADNSLSNKFILKCEINNLLKHGICKKKGEFYNLNISKNTIQHICSRINFPNIFQ